MGARSQSRERASEPHARNDGRRHSLCMPTCWSISPSRRLRMRILQYAAAIAFGLSSGLLASVASAQDSATLKPFRDKSMIKIEYKAPTDKKLEPIYQRLKAREVLERMQAFLAPLRLPQPLNVITSQCGGQS